VTLDDSELFQLTLCLSFHIVAFVFIYLPPGFSRGYWAERLALNYDQHLRDPVSSWNAIQDALRDELVRGKYKVALKERADKLKNNSEVKSLEPLDLCKPYEFLKAKEVGGRCVRVLSAFSFFAKLFAAQTFGILTWAFR